MQGPRICSSSTADTECKLDSRGVVTLILGCMFSGKTTDLLRSIAAAASPVLAIKHAIDVRFADHAMVSHAGQSHPAVVVESALEILGHVDAGTRLVAIDEAHFFDPQLVEVIVALRDRRIDVTAASLEPDSWGRPFAMNEALRTLADHCLVKHATCARCGAVADRTQRLTPIIDGQMVVDPSNYEPRCLDCWRAPIEHTR